MFDREDERKKYVYKSMFQIKLMHRHISRRDAYAFVCEASEEEEKSADVREKKRRNEILVVSPTGTMPKNILSLTSISRELTVCLGPSVNDHSR